MNKLVRMLGASVVVTGVMTGCAVSPTSLTEAELSQQGKGPLNTVLAQQESVSKPITLYDAMARAIKYNLDYKVEAMEQALRFRELKLAGWDMLPQFVANAGYAGRDKFAGARSVAFVNATSQHRINILDEEVAPSTSQERELFTSDLRFSWDVLDFGLSYIRAKQKSDEYMIANERKRKVVNRIIEDVRTAYWRAVSAERLLTQLSELEGDIKHALAMSSHSYERKKMAPMAALTYQRELLTIQDEIQSLQLELSVSRQQLAALMNIEPGTGFQLVLPDRRAAVVDFAADSQQMVQLALENRPELRELSYQLRTNGRETTAALLDIFPSLNLYVGANQDSNKFLRANEWANYGAQASWNLLEVFRYPARKRTVKAQQTLLEQQALALSMAVVTQVHVSRTRFDISKRHLSTMRDYHDVQSRIMAQIDAGFSAKRVSKQTHIREQMNKIVAEVKYDIALADLQNAFANIYSSMGLDPYGPDIDGGESVDGLSDKLRSYWKNLENIHLPTPIAQDRKTENPLPDAGLAQLEE